MRNLLLTFLVASCASAQSPEHRELIIRPGEVRLLEFPNSESDLNLFCRGEKLKLNKTEDRIQAVVTESYFSDRSPFTCALIENEKTITEINFKVEKKIFKSEKLKVQPRKIKLSKEDQLRVENEQRVLNKIYSNSIGSFQFGSAFRAPMDSFMTSHYGTKRVYNKIKQGQHLGIDYRAAIGDKVPSANSGKVVFSGDLFYTGWTVIIDHGLDIFSVYGHLSKTLVNREDFVERGQIIGLSGNTGRTSGPHLHWGVKIQGQYVDGLVLISETEKIFKD